MASVPRQEISGVKEALQRAGENVEFRADARRRAKTNPARGKAISDAELGAEIVISASESLVFPAMILGSWLRVVG